MTSPTVRLGPLPPVRVSPGTLLTVLLLAVIMYPSLSRGGIAPTTAVLLAIGIGLFMIVSVLVHEAAHALVARAFGASVDHIALTLWGGHTQYRSRQMSALGSLLVSLSGPAANLLLAGLCFAVGQQADPGTSLAVFFSVSSWLNLVLAVFNLLPGLPMDGGRALETLLGAVLSSPELGTRITAWLGRAIAVAVVAYPLWQIMRAGGAGGFSLLTLVWALLIAGMLWQGATQALAGAALQGRIRTLDAASLATPVRIVSHQASLSDLDPSADLSSVLILDRTTAASGTVGRASRIDPAAAAAVPVAQRAATPVLAVAGTIGEVGALPATLQGDDLIGAMLSHPAPAYLVLAEDGTARGVILSADVNALLRGR
ncbi:M50 family metallopeptidase [Brachybacterium vulturis]|uniref:M50 family metallopeptidase n=1 Tax=Brachybacterium vulturis TaxID=2017484 RepID=UPI00373597B7